MKGILSILLLSLSLIALPAVYADGNTEFAALCEAEEKRQNLDAEYFMCQIWNYEGIANVLSSVSDFVKNTLTPQVDQNTADIKTLQTLLKDYNSNAEIQAEILELEEMVIPDFNRPPIVKSFEGFAVEERDYYSTNVVFMIESFHDGDLTTVKFSDSTGRNWYPPHYSSSPDANGNQNYGHGTIISELGLERYEFGIRQYASPGDTITVRLSGAINHDYIVTIS